MPKAKENADHGITAKMTAFAAFIVALTAVIDAGVSLVGKVKTPLCSAVSLPWCVVVPGDTPPTSPETDSTRVHSFEFQSPPTEVNPGLRKWTKIAPDVWEQDYPDGTKNYNYKVKRISLFDCDGTVVSPKEDPDFQQFFPDKGCDVMTFMFRRLSQGNTWHAYVPINHVE
jgi:hypothetical protein